MKKRSIRLEHTRISESGRAQSARTGDHCPASGWWAPLDDEADAQFITEGSIMPSNNGFPGSWKLVVRHPQRRTRKPSHDFPPRGFALDSI